MSPKLDAYLNPGVSDPSKGRKKVCKCDVNICSLSHSPWKFASFILTLGVNLGEEEPDGFVRKGRDA